MAEVGTELELVSVAEGRITTIAGRYTLERELGRGGMAVVYLATDSRHHRSVAIKVLDPQIAESTGKQRFLQEIRIVAQLTHPNILTLIDSGQINGALYYVMPYVDGESLRTRLNRERQLPLRDALQIAREVAEALDYAHRQDVMHRDIKPENILLEDGHAVVADFGIACAIREARGESCTMPGVVVGTPSYLSPEVCSGTADLDARVDIYALGCVLYEMLTGEPPFTGPNGQAIMARHVNEPVPSPRVLRPSLSESVEATVKTALAKAPADRFSSAAELAETVRVLETGEQVKILRAVRRRTRFALAVAGVGVAAFLGWRVFWPTVEAFDPQRVVVFPTVQSGELGGNADLGEQVTIALLNALNSTEVVKAVDGWRLLTERQRADVRGISPRTSRSLAHRAGAGAYLEGRILAADSLRLSLQLMTLDGESGVQRVIAFARSADPWTIGVHAATALLPALIPAGRRGDLVTLNARDPAATASFLRGEQAYRRAQFEDALGHYRHAVVVDTAFALAALRGAQAASWNYRLFEAGEFLAAALTHAHGLNPQDLHLARGFSAYLRARADSAVRHFRLAVVMEPEWPEAWTMLGEVYTHLLPLAAPLDSLAEVAFRAAHIKEPDFGPALYHLLEIAIRKGDRQEARRLLNRFQAGTPDSRQLLTVDLMYRCVFNSPSIIDWRRYVHRGPQQVVDAARSLTVGGIRQPVCAESAWRAVLAHDSARDNAWDNRRWGALRGLHAVLVAQGRTEELKTTLSADTVFGRGLIERLHILAALAGADVHREAAEAADHLQEVYRADPTGMRSLHVWHLGIWNASRGDVATAEGISGMLATRAASSGDRRERLLSRSLAARVALAAGDSNVALGRLQTLVPDTGRAPLTWNAWESLGGERMLLAELLMASGRYAEAWRVASNFDAPAPVPYTMYVPASLALRIRIARALQQQEVARGLTRRLVALGREDLIPLDVN